MKTGEILKGLSVSSGVGIGIIHRLEMKHNTKIETTFTTAEEEIARLQQAIDHFCYRTYGVFQKMRSLLGQDDALILGGQIFMARDLEFVQELHDSIRSGNTAEKAVELVFNLYLSYFQVMEDELMAQRGADLSDMRDNILELLSGQGHDLVLEDKTDVILCGEDISPSVMAQLNPDHVVGILCQKGGITSHCAILARATGIPAIFGVSQLMERVEEGASIIVDGSTGLAVLHPEQNTLMKYQEKSKYFTAKRHELEKYRKKSTRNAGGEVVPLMVNISDFAQVHTALEMGADGVGLFRTEYLYMDRKELPTEEEQRRTFSRVASMMSGNPVVIRTLDIGGDKQAPCLSGELEENPFLGQRAIRYCLKHKEIFMSQLRGILRASGEHENLSILVPFVTEVDEIIEIKLMIEQCKDALLYENIPVAQKIPVGVVVETPAAAIVIDHILDYVDFVSIGTNDMTQYIMAADRGNAGVADYYSVFQLSVLRILKFLIATCNRRKVPVTVCGEAVADPRMIPLLLAFGEITFSVSPASVLGLRREIASWNRDEAKEIAQQVLKMSKTRDIEKYLNEIIACREESLVLLAT